MQQVGEVAGIVEGDGELVDQLVGGEGIVEVVFPLVGVKVGASKLAVDVANGGACVFFFNGG